jgi:OHCU decarboxylase
MIALRDLNRLPPAEFTAALAGLFERSAWVAERAAASRPFASCHDLLDAMNAVVAAAAADEQLALIRAHPRLGLRGRARADITAASAQEQRGAGLDAVDPGDLARLDALNTAYAEKFSMPFILAVRGHTPKSIIAACEQRLGHDREHERRTALGEIGRIAGYRLTDLVSEI